MEEVQKIVKEALEKVEKGQNKQKVFEEARVKLLKLQEKYYSENKQLGELNVLYDIKELARKLGVKYKDFD
ncbi:MAG TPA: hypothetical protein VJA47_04105 [archaeon]|nr:hypothetical protein [archaeon]